MYCNGGGHNNYNGSSGPVHGLSEAWVNWDVAMAMCDIFDDAGSSAYYHLTRDSITQDVSIIKRINFANQYQGDFLLSIHHNGLPLGSQGTEVRWCDSPTNSLGEFRPDAVMDSTFAKKALYRLLDGWEYKDRCYGQIQHCKQCGSAIKLIWNVELEHVLTEASNLYDTTEENLFYTSGEHAEEEAWALFLAYNSELYGQGFGRIEYKYLVASPSPDPCTVWVDFSPYDVPYERCWTSGETYTVEAPSFFQSDGYVYTFNRWLRVDYTTGQILTPPYDPGERTICPYAGVDMDGYHYLEAYYTGGPFYVDLLTPHSGTIEIQNFETQEIRWNAPSGAKGCCSLYVDYSINGGTYWLPIVGPVPYNYWGAKQEWGLYNWDVPDIIAPDCRLRLIAYDVVGNCDTTISHQFGIVCYTPTADFSVSGYDDYLPIDVDFTDLSTHQPTSWTWNFGDGDISHEQHPTHTYDDYGLYSVTLTVSNQCGQDDTTMVDVVDLQCQVIAGFYANQTSGSVPLLVYFIDNSDPSCGGDWDFLWDFGDGTSSQEMCGATHRYDSPSLYDVSLIIGRPCGGCDTLVRPGYIDARCADGTYGDEWARVFHVTDGFSGGGDGCATDGRRRLPRCRSDPSGLPGGSRYAKRLR